MDFWKGSSLFNEIVKKLKPQARFSAGGINDGALSSLIGSVSLSLKRNILVIIDREKELKRWSEDISCFTEKEALMFPSDFPSHQIETLKEIISSRYRAVIAAPRSISEKVYSPKEFNRRSVKIAAGETAYEEIVAALKKGMYYRTDTVAEPGEYARRGEVIDFWPPETEAPVRLRFQLDKVCQISFFNHLNQRTTQSLEEAEIIPAEYTGESTDSRLTDYLGTDFIVFSTSEEYEDVENIDSLLPADAAVLTRVRLVKPDVEFSARSLTYGRSFSEARSEIEALKEADFKIFLTAPAESELNKVKELMKEEFSLECEGKVCSLHSGFISDDLKTAVLTIGDILPYHRTVSYAPPPPLHPVEEYSDLNEGDFVLHKKFGVGMFEGIKQITHDSSVTDFLSLKYRGESRLYVAVENADLIQKYIGSRWKTKLDSLSGKTWERTQKDVRKSVRELTKKLLEVFSAREKKGTAFDSYPEMEKEFAEKFPYRLTRHQQQAVDEVMKDMESPAVMDRLVCGDVGYGKTEVAMRAAFKAVVNGKQAAVLAPTTVLARQHFHTFRNRFSDFPVLIEMLSKLVSDSDQQRIVQSINEGKVDIVIGTHKLFSRKIKFPALGLIIIDEEQRFGVEQKEKLRFKYKNVDVLTTTATPIPRTLSMALGRVKGFSLINTPPPGRQGVKTTVMPYDRETVIDAINHEKSRGGQCYFVHSRVGSIKAVMENLKKDLPGVVFGYIHGRMKPEAIDRVMEDFIEGKIDCLVSTTIIENGLDIPSVNTMIIDSAHRLGLADIYQLRGRVGRSDIRAYCYLMYPPYLEMAPQVKERLSALESFSALGGGFQLALRDLQLRGAGELLGPKQHGNIMKVGLEYYSSILKEEIARLKGEEYVEPVEVEISLPVSAYIPEEYLASSPLRLAFYRRLSAVKETEELEEIKNEMADRFGNIPSPLNNLIKIIEIKIAASEAKVKEVLSAKNKLIFKLLSGESIEREFAGDIFKAAKKELESVKRKIQTDSPVRQLFN